jgi:nucleotide-binding universal stress UspA family protein
MTGDIVVGVDESASSRAALQVAAHEAALRGVALHAVYVWFGGTMPVCRSAASPGELAYRWLSREVAALQAQRTTAGEPPVGVTIEVMEGDPESELRAAAKGARLLVLGERHHRGPNDLVSSVSHALEAHPPCPVLIVPSPGP